ncbi:MAG: mechanosensitive ion channel family protein [Prochlorothrix sp.]
MEGLVAPTLDVTSPRLFILGLALRLGLFLLGAIVSPLAGRWLVQLLLLSLRLLPISWLREILIEEEEQIRRSRPTSLLSSLASSQNTLVLVTSLGFIRLCLQFLEPYAELQSFIGFYLNLALLGSSVWLLSKVIRQGVRQGIARLLEQWGRSPSPELLVVIETLLYIPLVALIVVGLFPRLGFFTVQPDTQNTVFSVASRLGIFLLGTALSPGLGQLFPRLVRWLLRLTLPQGIAGDSGDPYQLLLQPFQPPLVLTGTLGCIALSLNSLSAYEDLYTFLGFFIYLALSISVAWLAFKVMKRVVRQVLISVLQQRFGQVTEGILVFETLIYVSIVVLAIVIFAQGLRLNIFALTASLGISGVAVAFASQQALGRLVGTIELYLDRPYVPGEYIRVTFNPYGEDVYGRVESVGLRSTKIRTVAKNTLVIVPNSTMAGLNIENISRGKKIMALVCLDFNKVFQEQDQALVKQVIEEATQAFWGLEQASTRIQFVDRADRSGTRTRIIFFITGSSQNSLGLRKRLIELANDAIGKRLLAYNLRFTFPEPTIYIDSPISL